MNRPQEPTGSIMSQIAQQALRRANQEQPEQPGNPVWPFDPNMRRRMDAPSVSQRQAAGGPPPITDPNFEQWYQNLPAPDKIRYKNLYEQWLATQ